MKTDDLRTRIANAIDDGHITYEQSLEMADAVIREIEDGYVLVPLKDDR